MIVMLYATPERLTSREAEIKRDPWPMAFTEVAVLTTDDGGKNEPFGFRDGISQPVIDWERTKPTRLRDTIATHAPSAMNACAQARPMPLLPPVTTTTLFFRPSSTAVSPGSKSNLRAFEVRL